MSTAALRMQSCRLRVEVLTSSELTTVARSLHQITHPCDIRVGLGVDVAFLLELCELAKPVEMPSG